MVTTMKLYVNCDTLDQPLGVSGVDWAEVNLLSDSLIFSNGSDTVKDGEPIPSETALNQAGVVIQIIDVIVPKYFLADISLNLLRELHNAGNQNKRYVYAFDFDGATASEPVLELWDDSGLDSVDIDSLGAGDAEASWWRGITTTAGAPAPGWVGSKLAGSTPTHFLYLNAGAGALTVAKTLYCNLKVIVPANFTNAGADKPVFAVKYTTN